MHVCVCNVCVLARVHERERERMSMCVRRESVCDCVCLSIPQAPSSLCFRTGSLPGLKFGNSAELAGQ